MCINLEYTLSVLIYALLLPFLQSLLSSAREKKPRGRYAKLEDDMERSNQEFIDQQKNQQQVMLDRQDEQLVRVGASVSTLKRMGQAIGDELDDQQV